jgi:hypothetical protein
MTGCAGSSRPKGTAGASGIWRNRALKNPTNGPSRDQPTIVVRMPRVSAFYGVIIYMYWNERDHPLAHFHAYHAGRRASVSVDGTVLAGSLEHRALQFVREWANLRHEEIMANWERARKNEPLLGIPPLP